MGIIKTKKPRQYANSTQEAVCGQSAQRLSQKGLSKRKKKERSNAGYNMAGYCKARRNNKPSNHPIKSTSIYKLGK